MKTPPLGWVDVLLFVAVVAGAAGLRAAYVVTCVEGAAELPFQVQDAETAIVLGSDADAGLRGERSALVENVRDHGAFACKAPLAGFEEDTAHVAPAYPWLVGVLARWLGDAERTTAAIRWCQVALGALTAGLYFLFALRAFGSALVALLAGMLAAAHPFWVVNVAELQDGTLASFLLAACLYIGTEGARRGGPVASLTFGLALAALALTRAALLPFAFVACLWYLLRCRTLPRGWVCALLAFLGFANGLAPWLARDVRTFGDLVPIVDTLYLHLWVGNNALARGGPQDERTLRESLPPDRYQALMAEPNQARRYGMLVEDVWARVQQNPTGVVEKRLRAAVCFVVGAAWLRDYVLVRESSRAAVPEQLAEPIPLAMHLALLGMALLAPLGWRWSYGWRREANLGSLALLWVPVPYLLTHADFFSGPRLPLDGILLCYAAFALAWMFPPVARVAFVEPTPE
jgi:hypothetical protein